MNRRTLVVAVVVALMTASVHAADSARTQDAAATPLPRAERPLELRALFHRAPGVAVHTPNGFMTGPSHADVIVARIDKDGKLVKACVDSEEAARRFLNAPIEQVAGRKAQEH